jgi:hypothetical protein
MAPHVLPSAGYLHECLVYDPERGTLKWRRTRPAEHFANITHQRNWMTRHAGKNAYAGMGSFGYKRTRIDGVYYLSHRIIYKMMTLDDPASEIGHINRHRDDNRWVNLRVATRQQIVWNSPNGTPRRRSDSRDLPTGVFRKGKKYGAACGHEYLGIFNTLDEASNAYTAYVIALRSEFYHKKRPSVAGVEWWTRWDG